jgi:hypothetical protein
MSGEPLCVEPDGVRVRSEAKLVYINLLFASVNVCVLTFILQAEKGLIIKSLKQCSSCSSGWRDGGTLVCAKHCPMPGVAMAVAVAFGRVARM